MHSHSRVYHARVPCTLKDLSHWFNKHGSGYFDISRMFQQSQFNNGGASMDDWNFAGAVSLVGLFKNNVHFDQDMNSANFQAR